MKKHENATNQLISLFSDLAREERFSYRLSRDKKKFDPFRDSPSELQEEVLKLGSQIGQEETCRVVMCAILIGVFDEMEHRYRRGKCLDTETDHKTIFLLLRLAWMRASLNEEKDASLLREKLSKVYQLEYTLSKLLSDSYYLGSAYRTLLVIAVETDTADLMAFLC